MRSRTRPTPSKPPKVRVLVVLGSNVELLRAAPVALVLRGMPEHFEVRLVGARLDDGTDAALAALGLALDARLPGGPGADLTASVGAEMDRDAERRPHVVLVAGDSELALSTSLACLARSVELAHVGAGLRTDARAPTGSLERRRRAITALASLHFPSTDVGRARLLAEGVDAGLITVSGNPIVEALEPLAAAAGEGAARSRVVAVVSTDAPTGGLERWVDESRQIALDTRGEVLLVTPSRTGTFDADGSLSWSGAAAPLADRARWALHAKLVVTDCADAEEMCVALGTPVVVARARTELVEALAASVSEVVGVDMVRAFARARAEVRSPRLRRGPRPLGDGKASLRIALALTAFAARLISDEQARRAA